MITDNMAEHIVTGTIKNGLTEQVSVQAFRFPDGTHVTLSLAREIAKKALTWQDVRQIVMIADDLDPLYNPDALDAEFQSEEALYTEVLKRFQEGKP